MLTPVDRCEPPGRGARGEEGAVSTEGPRGEVLSTFVVSSLARTYCVPMNVSTGLAPALIASALEC